MIIIGPGMLLCIMLLAFRPIRRIVFFCLLVLTVLAVGAFGHVQAINEAPWIALPIAAAPFVLARMGRRSN